MNTGFDKPGGPLTAKAGSAGFDWGKADGMTAKAGGVTAQTDITFMRLALEQARMAACLGEAPVGAVIACGGEVVSAAHNLRESGKSALAHAELLAIGRACEVLGGWRLHRCDIYVTLEPCPMCAGAIVNARIARVVFGAHDPKAGCFGSVTDFTAMPFNHAPALTSGLLADESAALLREFFRKLRKPP